MNGVAELPVGAGQAAAAGLGAEVLTGSQDVVDTLEEDAVGIEMHGLMAGVGWVAPEQRRTVSCLPTRSTLYV